MVRHGRPETPLVAVDIVIEHGAGGRIVLIERRNPPAGWALPGGFVDIGETVECAAVREAREETGLEVTLKCLLGCYSNPARDPRGHTVSLVYVAAGRGVAQARDDAKALRLADPGAPGVALAFDHARILGDYCRYLETGRAPGWKPPTPV